MPALVSVYAKPVINSPPASRTVTSGGDATLSADINGTGLTYQWYRNGSAIPGATNATFNLTGIHNNQPAIGSTAGHADFFKGKLDDLQV